MRTSRLSLNFSEFIPDALEPGILYITMEYGTAVHLCACGCGEQVITPFSPTDWKLQYDGESITLHPSIGNWSFPCKSHYWIRNSQIRWAESWEEYMRQEKKVERSEDTEDADPAIGQDDVKVPILARILSTIRSWFNR